MQTNLSESNRNETAYSASYKIPQPSITSKLAASGDSWGGWMETEPRSECDGKFTKDRKRGDKKQDHLPGRQELGQIRSSNWTK